MKEKVAVAYCLRALKCCRTSGIRHIVEAVDAGRSVAFLAEVSFLMWSC